MKSTSWQKLLGLGACVALAAGGCTVSSGSDDDDGRVTTGIGGSGGSGGSGGTDASGGSAGESSGGSSTTTTTTTTTTSTTGATGGTGGAPVELECLDGEDDTVPGTPASCDFQANDSCCTKCVATNFCDEYADCFASPANICGGTVGEDNSELFAFIDCMINIDGGALPGTAEGSDFETCIVEDATSVSEAWCSLGTISGPTNALATAMMGDEDGFDGCFAECLDSTFDEANCLYEE